MYRLFQRAWFLPGMLLFILQGCSTVAQQTQQLLAQRPSDLPVRFEIKQVPFTAQKEYQCGPASLASLLNWQHVQVSQDDLIGQVYIPERQGSLQIEMLAATRRYGLVPYVIAPNLSALLHEVHAGNPVLVLQNLALEWYPRWHYAVVIGYDLDKAKLVLHSGEIQHYVMNLDTFEHTWRRAKYWGVVALPADRLPATAEPHGYMQSVVAFEQLGQLPVAMRGYQTALQRWPQDRNLLMGMANGQLASQQYAAAETSYRTIIQQWPDFAPALNNLAETLYQLKRYPEAAGYARQAVQLGGRYRGVYQQTLQKIQDVLPK